MIALAFAWTAPGGQCRAETADAPSNVLKDAEDTALARQQWQEWVRAERRRIRELAVQRRLQPPEVETIVSQERRATERVLNDMTLRRGDIVVTDKGAFVFIGNAEEDRMPDFVPVEPKRR